MDEVAKVLLSAPVAVLIFVLCQGLLKLVIEPSIDLRRTIGEIEGKWLLHGNLVANPASLGEGLTDLELQHRLEASRALRECAGALRGKSRGLIGHSVAARLGVVPDKTRIDQASKALIGLSNSAVRGNSDHIAKWEEQLSVALGFVPHSGSGMLRVAIRQKEDQRLATKN
jgi:hypothetical protein